MMFYLFLSLPLDSVTSLISRGIPRVVYFQSYLHLPSPQKDTYNTILLPLHVLVPFDRRYRNVKDV